MVDGNEVDPDFDLGSRAGTAPQDENLQGLGAVTAEEAQNNEASAAPKSRKKKRKKARDEAAAAKNADAAGDNEGEQESLPSISQAPKTGQIIEAFDIGGTDGNEEEAKVKDDLEISDEEAPDVAEAKRNLRSQAENKRKKKGKKATVVQGVTEDVQVEVVAPVNSTPDDQEWGGAFPDIKEQRAQETNVMPGLQDDDAPASEAEDSVVLEEAPQVLAPDQEDTPGKNEENPTATVAGNVVDEEAKEPQNSIQTPIGVEEEVKESIQQYEEIKLPPIVDSKLNNQDSEQLARQLQNQYDGEDRGVAADEAEAENQLYDEGEGKGRRRKGKKGRRRQRQPGGAGPADLEFRDNADIELMSNDFSREHFRKMIKKTFDDYYPLEYNKSTFNLDQYLDVVSKEQLETKYSVYLEANDDANILTMKNMPWLDLGELPVSYNTHKTEAFQVYMIPQGELPMNIVVSYDNWSGEYSDKKVIKNFEKTNFGNKGIQLSDMQDTLKRATELVSGYRGKLAFRNRIIKICLFIAGLFFFFLAVLIGMLDHGNYWFAVIMIIVYLIIFLIVITIFKYRSSYSMRMTQFLLSVFCRAENNRLYLKHGVEVRPGFTGKWIEFTCLENNGTEEIIKQMRQRFLKPCLEQKAAIFDKEIMSQKALVDEQKDIENQMKEEQNQEDFDRDAAEHAEVAAAVLESNPNDFSQEQDLSQNALGAQSSSAISQNVDQPPGLPPSVINLDGQKKEKKKRRKKKKTETGALEIDQNFGQ